MIRNKLMLFAALLAAAAVLAGGCAPAQPTTQPTTQPTADMLTAQQAFNVALTWVEKAYPDEAPAADLSWTSEDVVPRGSDGQPLAGGADTRMTSADWVADITWALVSRELVLYAVTLKSPTLGWYWEGTVRAVGGQVTEDTGLQLMSVSLASELARQFVVSSRTYMSSGVSGSVQMLDVSEADCQYCWTFVYEFSSKHSGYGNGAGQVIVQAVTPHRAIVTIEAMDVTEGIMDGRWDMKAQQFIELDEDGARTVAQDFVRNSPTFAFDGIGATLEAVEAPGGGDDGTWMFEVSFQSAHAGYGDRTGQVLAQVVTPHVAQVTIANGNVVSAIMDEQWDMLKQSMVA